MDSDKYCHAIFDKVSPETEIYVTPLGQLILKELMCVAISGCNVLKEGR